MRSSKSRSRNKQNRNTRPTGGNIINRVFDSSGPDGKVRGTPQQIIEKYNQLYRDAQLSGDRIAAENFAQHAEHYTRLLAEAMREVERAREEQEQWNRERQSERDRERAARVRVQEDQAADPAFSEQPDLPVTDGALFVDLPEADAAGLVETPEEQPRPAADRRDRREPRPEARTDARGERREPREPREPRPDRREPRPPREPQPAVTLGVQAEPEALPAFITAPIFVAAEPVAAEASVAAEPEKAPRRRTRKPKDEAPAEAAE